MIEREGDIIPFPPFSLKEKIPCTKRFGLTIC
jgi:hypothetical protein